MQNPSAILCALAIIAAQLLYGGFWRPIFAIPALLLIGAVGVVGLGAFWGVKRSTPSTACLLFATLLFSWLLYREWQTPDAWTGAASLRLTLACFITYLIFSSISVSSPSRMLFISILFLAALIQSSIGIYFFFHNLPGMPFDWLSEQLRLWYEPRSLGRAHGFYLNANHLAWFLNFATLFALSFACWARWPAWARIIALYVAAISLAGTIFTMSRGGFIGLASGLAVFLFLSTFTLIIGARGKRWIALASLVGGLTLIGGGGYLIFSENSMVQGRFDTLLLDSYRERMWGMVVRQMQVDPLFGTGPSSYETYAKTFRTFVASEQDFFAHNDVAQIAADFGFIALALLVIALLLHFWNGFSGLSRSLRRRMAAHTGASSNSAAVIIGALTVGTAFLAHSFFDFNMQLPANALLAAAVFGILANSGVERSAEGWREKGNALLRFAATSLVVSAGVVLLLFSLKASKAENDYLLAENAFLLGDIPKALAILNDAAAASPEHNRIYALRARVLLDQRTSERRQILIDAGLALEELEAAESISSLDSTSLLTRATAQGRLGKFSEAEKTSLAAILVDPLSSGGYEIYGMSLEAMGNFPMAIRNFRVAQTLGGKAAIGHLQRVQGKLKREAEKKAFP